MNTVSEKKCEGLIAWYAYFTKEIWDFLTNGMLDA